jgi:hypothetical protein
MGKPMHQGADALITTQTQRETNIKVNSQKSKEETKGKKLQKKALQSLIKSP